jgi:inositol-pentakisphosphate 2-kinase
MHSYLKWARGETALREYCPLDLFSGDRTRVEHAVGALWHDWIETKGSTNNLKIFSHGKIVKPEDVRL